MTGPAQQSDENGRDETTLERLDRNTIELLNELRVASTGIQVMFGFLLIVPFNNGFRRVSPFEKTVYFITLCCVAIASVVLMAPSVHHRILFRRQEKAYLVETGNRLAVVSLVFIGLGFTGILVLLSDFVLGGAAPLIVGVVAAAGIGILWFALPIGRRIKE